MSEFFSMELYVQNELMECDFLEQQAKMDYDHSIAVIKLRRSYAEELRKELKKETKESEGA